MPSSSLISAQFMSLTGLAVAAVYLGAQEARVREAMRSRPAVSFFMAFTYTSHESGALPHMPLRGAWDSGSGAGKGLGRLSAVAVAR